MFDVQAVRAQFPALRRNVAGRPLVYLDSAASSLKAQVVVDAVSEYLSTNGANIHRGLHSLSQEASEAYESTRALVARFIGASAEDEIVFTKNATESLNLVAGGLPGIERSDNVVGTILDHHSNIVPWQLRCQYRYADILGSEHAPASAVARLVDGRTRAIVAPLYSNVTGSRVAVEELAVIARERGIPLVVDAAQGAGHVPISVADVDADFLAFSGHKMCGPPGVGVLFGRREWLHKLAPVYGGGGMVATLDQELGATYRLAPWRFEAGTPDIGAVLGLGAAIRFLDEVDLDAAHAHVMGLRNAGAEALREARLDDLFEVRTGDPADNAGIFALAPRSASVDAVRLSQILSDTHGVMTRAGSHCAHPLHKALGWAHGSLRISLQLYNTVEEITYAMKCVAQAARHL